MNKFSSLKCLLILVRIFRKIYKYETDSLKKDCYTVSGTISSNSSFTSKNFT